ncbi:FMN-dependent alpha-hydroxy acid dehydrogenase [Trametes sanguinea]|nr:FMN-dependent alpha-hydroxy acid dehydrogenase [Trametes sanguinea]
MDGNASNAPAPKMWSKFMRDSYLSRAPPPTGTVDFQKIEDAAREKLKDRQDAFLYVFGNAGTGESFHDNRKELSKWKVIPRQLRDATHRSIETTIFGQKYSSPLFLAPVGVQGIVHRDAELATAAAARELGVPMILSTAASRSIEAVAQANGTGQRWFQLYWPLIPEVTLSLMKRAKDNGYTALVVTLDTMTLGWRPHDIDTAYLPFYHAVGAQVGLTDPVFMKRFGLEPVAHDDVPDFPYDPAKFDELLRQGDKKATALCRIGVEWVRQVAEGVYRTWDQLAFIRQHWDGPLILKGVLSVEDAQLAINAGVDGIVVSNHGGRQIDGSIPALWALEKICQAPRVKEAQLNGRFTVLYDSGIRSGTDIFRAIALGAQGVLLGRPYIYGLIVGDQAGVETVVKSILAEFEITLGLCGYKSIAEIWGRASEIMVKID